MTDPVIIGDATLHCGDCLDILPTLGPVDAVVTDPVWPNVTAGFIPGWEAPQLLLANALERIETTRLVLHLGCLSDPRFLAAVPSHLKFFRTCWLEHAVPHYIGRVLQGSDVAYCFGPPIMFQPGRQVVPGRAPKSQPGTTNREHPCARSETFVDWLTGWFSDQGETVLDPFMGSGTTGVACMKLGRKFIGIEIHRPYFEIACRRIETAQKQADLFVPKDWQKRDSVGNYDLAIETIRHKRDK